MNDKYLLCLKCPSFINNNIREFQSIDDLPLIGNKDLLYIIYRPGNHKLDSKDPDYHGHYDQYIWTGTEYLYIGIFGIDN